MKLLSVAQIREFEKKADSIGLSYSEMMLRAATGVAEFINSRFEQKKYDHEVIGLAGPGNNGGDTLVALRLLQSVGWKTRAITFFRNKKEDLLLTEYIAAGGTIIPYDEQIPLEDMSSPTIIIDGILGTGTSLPIRPRMQKVLDEVTQQFSAERFIRIAIDCPSGMDCDTGKVDGLVLPADYTICMAGVKQGLVQPEALSIVGELIAVPIGFDDHLPDWSEGLIDVVSSADIARMLPERAISGHKGTFGSVCVIGGSSNYVGAPVLAGKAAYRTGCGLVQLAVPESIYPMIARFIFRSDLVAITKHGRGDFTSCVIIS